jgi:predicted patatin/cPLA2 family phospholipase
MIMKEKKGKRALVIGVGGLRGAYDAGALSVLAKKLPKDYFDRIYASSVGAFLAPLLITRQPEILEEIWRRRVHGRKLFSLLKILKGREIMDLQYIIEMINQEGKTEMLRLKTDELFKSKTKLSFTLLSHKDWKIKYFEPNKENIFQAITAASTIPLINKSIIIDGEEYEDGGMYEPLPIKQAILDGYEEIVVVYNKPEGFLSDHSFLSERIYPLFMTKRMRRLIAGRNNRTREIDQILKTNKKIIIIRPKSHLKIKSVLDTHKGRVNDTFDRGIKDAEEAVPKILAKEQDSIRKTIQNPLIH